MLVSVITITIVNTCVPVMVFFDKFFVRCQFDVYGLQHDLCIIGWPMLYQ